jgi:hypothetical protein
MTRNLKVLSLALLAILALSAVVALGASAQQGKLISFEGKAVTLTAEEEPLGVNAMTAFNFTTKCPGTTYDGSKVGELNQLLPNKSTEATITPTYRNCKTFAGVLEWSTTVNMRGCDYVFHIGSTTGEQKPTIKTFALTADVA